MSLKATLLAVLLAFSSCNAGRLDKEYTSPKGEVLWAAPGFKGYEVVAVIALTQGGIEIFAEPRLTYQRARDCGAAFNPIVRVCTEYIEVTRGLAPANAMETLGWRDPTSRYYFPLQVFPAAQGSALRVPNRETGIPNEIRIFERFGGSWLIVIQTTSLVYDLDAMPEVAGGENR